MKTRTILEVFSAALVFIFVGGGCARDIDKGLVNAAYAGDLRRIEQLLQEGADPNELAVDGWNALPIAAREGHAEAVSVLLRAGAKINAPEGGGNTALFWAAFYDRRDVITLLIADGADVNKKARGGETPLHVALRLGHQHAAELLRNAGAKD